MNRAILILALLALFIAPPSTIAEPTRVSATLKEQWRLADSEDSFLIGDIGDAAADAAGNTYLFDFKLQSVTVVGPTGGILRTLGRPGDGPGETRTATRLFVEPDGRVGLLDAVSSRLVWFSAAGQPLPGGHLRLNADGTGSLVTYDARRYAGGYVAAFMVPDEAARSRAFQVALVRIPDDGSAPVVLHRVADTAASIVGKATKEAELHNFVWTGWDVTRDGTVYLAPDRDRPRVLVLPPGGGKPDAIELVTARRDRTAAEKAAVAARFAAQGGAAGMEIADAEPCVGRLWCDELGRPCVYTPAPQPAVAEGVFIAYDVYSDAGVFLQRVELLGPGDARRDNWFLLPGRRLVVVRNALDAESGEAPEVLGYSF